MKGNVTVKYDVYIYINFSFDSITGKVIMK